MISLLSYNKINMRNNLQRQKSQPPYTLLLHNKSSQVANRTPEEIQIMSELILHNRIFQYLGLAKNAVAELCHKLMLIWTDHPHILETNNHQVYLILEGKAFEYMHNKNMEFKAKMQENNDYLMVRKLLPNDFFIVFSPEARYADQSNYKKYQMMVDQGSLIAKIEGELYTALFLPLIEEKSRKVSSFLRQIEMFNYLPHQLMHELSRYMDEVSISTDTQIIKKNDSNPYVYFIQSGQVEFRSYNSHEVHQSPSKNYKTTFTKQFKKIILKQGNLFGLDSFNSETYEEKQILYAAQAKSKCLLYRLQKRILAIVIASFEETFQKRGKLLSSVNLNDQIQGQGYQTQEKAQLSRNASIIKSSEKKIRDIKLLRYFQASERKRAAASITPFHEGVQDEAEELLDIKYKSCQNFSTLKSYRDKNKKFYQTLNVKFNTRNPYQEASSKKVNQIVLSAFQEDQGEKTDPSKPVNVKKVDNKSHSVFHIRRRSEIKPSGKEESDILKAFMEKKLKNQMMKKAEAIVQRKSSQMAKKNIHIKRFYSQKNIRTKSNCEPRNSQKQIEEQLLEKMNRIDQYPLVNLIENQRQKMQAQAKRILENKLRVKEQVKRIIKPSLGSIVIQNNEGEK